MITKSVILKPVLTEKATQHAAKGVYLFEVAGDARKTQIIDALEGMYKVTVAHVRVLNRKGKVRKAGKTMKETTLPSKKRAYVTLKSGKFDLFPQA